MENLNAKRIWLLLKEIENMICNGNVLEDAYPSEAIAFKSVLNKLSSLTNQRLIDLIENGVTIEDLDIDVPAYEEYKEKRHISSMM